MKTLKAFLQRHRRIGIDTSIFIYYLEANPRYVNFAEAIFRTIANSGRVAITSTLTMTELLVRPYRDSDEEQVNQYYALLTTYPDLSWIAPDLEIVDLAAKFRAQFNLRTPDAIQAATAARNSASGFITNDDGFRRVTAFETLQLDDLLIREHKSDE